MQKGMLLLSCLSMLLLLNVPALAASFDLDVEVLNPSTCPTIIKGEDPLTKDDIKITVSNWLAESDTISMEFSFPSDEWSGFIQEITLGSGESQAIDAIWVTVPNVAPGEYPVSIVGTSGQTDETVKKDITINVLSCHALGLSLDEAHKNICLETDKEVAFQVELENLGKGPETFELSAKINGLPADSVSLSASEITLGPDEKKTVGMTVNTEGMSGTQNIELEAKSPSSYATASQSVSVSVSDCFGFDISVKPRLEAVCLGRDALFTLSIENTGKSDTYKITTPGWVEPESDYISIPGNEKADIQLKASPTEVKQLDFDVTVESGRDPLLSKNATATLDVHDCREVAVSVSPSKNSVCEGESAIYAVTVKNLGTIVDNYEVSTTLGSLDSTEVVVDPEKMRSMRLTVDTKGMMGEKIIKVIARSDYASDETFADLVVKDCYTADVTLEPENVSVCPCSAIDYTVTVKNTGELPDTYNVTFGNQKENVSLKAGESKPFEYKVTVPCDMKGTYRMSAKALSERGEFTGSSNLVVKTTDECWSADLVAGGPAVLVDEQETATVSVKVKNLGEQPLTYTVSLEGPDWVYIQPEELTLHYGEEEDVFLYVAPPMGTDTGEYTATVRVSSEHHASETNISIYVGVEPEEPQAEPGQESPGPQITGRLVSAIPAWKTIVVGVITLIIIMILVVRFAILFKS